MQSQIIVIGGPTASGKTAVAIEIAKYFNTEILSADSRQFYKELSVGTAIPSVSELAQVKHHFIQSHSINEHINSGKFADLATPVLTDMLKKNNVAIVVGGSGLFIKSLLEGLDEFPEVDENTKANLKDEYAINGIEELKKELREKDFSYYTAADLNNHQRILRALEVIRVSNKPYSSFLNQRKTKDFPPIKYLALDIPRKVLYEKINVRVDNMIANNLIEEVKSVNKFKNKSVLQTIGYKEIFEFLDGKIDQDEAINQIKQHTRNYAKRQVTWFKNQGSYRFIAPNITEILSILDI
jgi:tRNA dimethylallyltransferase